MKFCPNCKTEKSIDNFWKNKRTTDGFTCYCKDCARLRQKKYTETHLEHIRTKANSFYLKNRDRIIKERHENVEAVKISKRKWKKNNKDKECAYANKRRAMILNAIPENADLEAIGKIYKEAADRRKNGENVHVDHIIPLMGKEIKGLHCAENLRIIPAKENLSKGNRVPSDIDISKYQHLIYK